MLNTSSTKRSFRNQNCIALLLVIGFYALCLLLSAVLIMTAFQLIRLHIGGKLVFICLVAAGAILWSIVPTLDPFLPPGLLLGEERCPRLFAEIGDIAKRSGQKVPESVYLTSDMNAWVAQQGGFMGVGRRRLLALGLPLMGTLSVSQFRAVLAHEFGHFSSADTKLAPWVYRTRMAIARTLQNLDRCRSHTRFLFELYGDLFMRVTMSVSRNQELVADALAVQIAGSKSALTSALQILQRTRWVSDAYWQSEVAPLLAAGLCPPLANGFAQFLSNEWVENRSRAILKQSDSTDAYDTHPSMGERIAALEHMPDGERPTCDAAATSLFEDIYGVERLLAAFLTNAQSPGAFQSVSWDEVGTLVRVPSWRRHIAYQSRALEGLTPALLPKAIQVVGRHGISGKLRDQPGVYLEYDQRNAFVTWIVGAALALALYCEGWELTALPGRLEFQHKGMSSFRLA
jgi:Zn-dependent protease with chaperone function